MFQFRRFPTYAYVFNVCCMSIPTCRFPHSEIRGSTLICSSPRLIAACHVLRRLPVPRHSPCALFYLTLSLTGGLPPVRSNYMRLSSSTKFSLAKLYLTLFPLRFLFLDSLFPLFNFQGALSVPRFTLSHSLVKVVGLDGLEPSTSRLSGVRSNRLSYKPIWWR